LEVPPKVEYELTDFGRTLEPILVSLRDWGEGFQAREQAAVPIAEPEVESARR
jgi:DNA-binding HxlR family transcriptional regulator